MTHLDEESVAAMKVSRWQAQFEVIKSAMATVEIRQLLTRGLSQAERQEATPGLLP